MDAHIQKAKDFAQSSGLTQMFTGDLSKFDQFKAAWQLYQQSRTYNDLVRVAELARHVPHAMTSFVGVECYLRFPERMHPDEYRKINQVVSSLNKPDAPTEHEVLAMSMIIPSFQIVLPFNDYLKFLRQYLVQLIKARNTSAGLLATGILANTIAAMSRDVIESLGEDITSKLTEFITNKDSLEVNCNKLYDEIIGVKLPSRD